MNRSDLSEEAIYKLEQAAQGLPSDGKPTSDDRLKLMQREAVDGLITNVDVLANPINGSEKEEQKKRADAAVVAMAVAQREIELERKEFKQNIINLDTRLDSGTFLEGQNWTVDIKLFTQTTKFYFEEFDRGSSSITPEQHLSVARGSLQMHSQANTPERKTEIASNPSLRRADALACSIVEQMLSDPSFKLKQGETVDDLYDRIEAKLAKMKEQDPARFADLMHSCNKQAQTCCNLFQNEDEKKEFSLQYSKMHDIMLKHPERFEEIRKLSTEAERDLALANFRNEIIAEISKTDPKGASLLAQKIEKISSSDTQDKLKSMYKEVTNALKESAKEIAKEMDPDDKWQIEEDMKTTGQLSEHAFEKLMPLIVAEGHAEEQIRARFAADPKGVSQILYKGHLEHEKATQQKTTEPEQQAKEPKSFFAELGTLFNSSNATAAGTAAAAFSPTASAAMAITQAAQQAYAALTPEAQAAANAAKATCNCQANKSVAATQVPAQTAPAQATTQSAATPSSSTTPLKPTEVPSTSAAAAAAQTSPS